MNQEITAYNKNQTSIDSKICQLLAKTIDKHLLTSESKIWHANPVWFIDENPIVGYSKQKAGVRLMFWSGMSFEEPTLVAGTGKFKDASIFYTTVDQVIVEDIIRWLEMSIHIQWDYKNIVKKKGVLERLK